jgi:hypothetical protein
MLFVDGFDEALLGWTNRNDLPHLTVYSYDKCARILIERDGMTADEAIEYLEFNTVGAWMGEDTPLFVRASSKKEINDLADLIRGGEVVEE